MSYINENILDGGGGNSQIFLKPLEKIDTDNIILWRNNPRVVHNFIYQKPFTREGHLKWFETMIEAGKAAQFVIIESATNTPIGSTYLRDIDFEHKKAEFGIFIGVDDAVNHGYGTEACKLICAYGFKKLELHKIFLRVFEWNKQAIRSYEKAGFQHEGLFHDDVYVNGIFHNVVFMGKFNPLV